jgi:ribosomal protein S18 acetylase RimI-like enzyme
MPSPPLITRATTADADDIAPLLDAYRRFYRQPTDLPAARAFIQARLATGESIIYLARDADTARALGFVQLYPTFSTVTLGPRWILNDLYVDEQARRLGIARLLMHRAMQHARDTGAHGMMLLTELTNTPAQQLYESLNWQRDTVYHRYTWKP